MSSKQTFTMYCICSLQLYYTTFLAEVAIGVMALGLLDFVQFVVSCKLGHATCEFF